MKNDLLARYARYSLADMVRGIDEHFPGETFGLPNLFLDERRLALARVIASVLARHEETYRRIWEENRGLIGYLRRADVPIPDALAHHRPSRPRARGQRGGSPARTARPLPARVEELAWARRPRWG